MTKLTASGNLLDIYADEMKLDRKDAQNEIVRCQEKIEKFKKMLNAINEVDGYVKSFYSKLSSCVQDNGNNIVVTNAKEFVNLFDIPGKDDYDLDDGSLELTTHFRSSDTYESSYSLFGTETPMAECEIHFSFGNITVDDESMTDFNNIMRSPEILQGETADCTVFASAGVGDDL